MSTGRSERASVRAQTNWDIGIVLVDSDLPSHPESVAFARRLVRELRDEIPETTLDELELVVSETVTNAVVHGGPPVHLLILERPERFLEIVISDGSHQTPIERGVNETSESGRGMFIVELLSSSWQVQNLATGKQILLTMAIKT